MRWTHSIRLGGSQWGHPVGVFFWGEVVVVVSDTHPSYSSFGNLPPTLTWNWEKAEFVLISFSNNSSLPNTVTLAFSRLCACVPFFRTSPSMPLTRDCTISCTKDEKFASMYRLAPISLRSSEPSEIGYGKIVQIQATKRPPATVARRYGARR